MVFLWFAKSSYDMILPYVFAWDLIFSGYDVNMLDYTPSKLPGFINGLTFATFAIIAPFLFIVNLPFAILGIPLWIGMGTYSFLSMLFDDVIPNADIRTYYKMNRSPQSN